VAKPEKLESILIYLCHIVGIMEILQVYCTCSPQKRGMPEVYENNVPVAGRILDVVMASSLSLAKRSWRVTATVTIVKPTLVSQSSR
jgi:pyruvate formate-lyase activating enzyme-like uncharacterized protein